MTRRFRYEESGSDEQGRPMWDATETDGTRWFSNRHREGLFSQSATTGRITQHTGTAQFHAGYTKDAFARRLRRYLGAPDF